MKCRIIQLLLFTLISSVIVSCSNDRQPSSPIPEGAVIANFKAGIGTRVEDDHWEENDAIGIAMLVRNGTEVINDVYNYHYITATSSGDFTPANRDMLIYFPQDGRNVSFRAYYPFYPRLDEEMIVPLTTADQSDLPTIDFMSADHLTGFSKDDPNVHLRFHHRLSKLVFNLSTQDNDDFISLADCQLTIKGLQTQAEYHLLEETFEYDENTYEDVVVPMRASVAERKAIVLPREAGPGVSFEFTTPNGDNFSVNMSDTLNFRSGFRYIFNVNLAKTAIDLTVEIMDWIGGPESNYEVMRVTTPAGESEGVEAGDVMKVYLNESGNYNFLESFTYNANGSWVPDSPVYWESIATDPAEFRASIVAADPINSTQLADILIADDLSVARNRTVNFVLRHAGSKATYRLTSDTFDQSDLANATITLPNYLVGGYEQNGEFIEGTGRSNITVDRSDTDNGVAIIQPQQISSGNAIATIMINGRPYTAYAGTDGFSYNAGEAKLITINIEKEDITVSARVVDWIETSANLNAFTVGTSVSGATGVLNNEQLVVYTGDETARTELASYRYESATNTWNPSATIYWEDLPDQETFYGSILRAPKLNDTQLDDYLLGPPVTEQASNGVTFQLSHAAAQVAVRLTSDDESFSDTDLAAMNIFLPDYLTGATVNNGVFVPGNTRADITVQKNAGTSQDSGIALIQPQTINLGDVVVRLEDPETGRSYTATYGQNIEFPAGVTTILNIDVSKAKLTISATVTDWETGQSVSLIPSAIEVTGKAGNTDDFFEGKNIDLYKLGSTPQHLVYSYLPDGNNGYQWTGIPIYWDDQPGLTLSMGAVYYPDQDTKGDVATGANSFTWDIDRDQSKGYDQFDILMSYVSLPSPQPADFVFRHVVSKVNLVINRGEFSEEEVRGMTISLNNLLMDGTASLINSSVTPSGTAGNVTPQADVAGSRYSAVVMPQTVGTDVNIVTITLPDYGNTPFTGKLERPLTFEAGKEHTITITLKKTLIELSATVEDWDIGDNGSVTIQ